MGANNLNIVNKRIARNTLLLYLRMLLIMGVSLYTVRIVLSVLGVVDYGLYNVIGGVVIMFSFLSATMSSASQRFFAYEIGRKNYDGLKKIFSMTMLIYIIIAVVFLILAETVGLWFLNYKMVIPKERIDAANWVYQFSILTFMMTMFTIPYNAVIIAKERMDVYAYVSIVEVLLKLLIVYLLLTFSFDKLKLYAVFTFVVTTLVTFIYRSFCLRKYKECKFSFYWNRNLFKKIINYSGWNLFGTLASILNNHGINIIMNLFFGPAVNASRAIAYRVNSSVSQFVSSFMTASRPQITKYYAAGEKGKMLKLVFQTSKFCFLLLFVLSMPFVLEANFILSIWLKQLPDYVVVFVRLIIVGSLIDSLSYPLMTAAQATGKIRMYQLVVGGTLLLVLPISYIFYKQSYPPETVFYLSIISSVIAMVLRLMLLNRMIQLRITDYITQVLLPLSLVVIFSYSLPVLLIKKLDYGWIRFFISSGAGMFTAAISIYMFALNKSDRRFLKEIIDQKLSKRKKLVKI